MGLPITRMNVYCKPVHSGLEGGNYNMIYREQKLRALRSQLSELYGRIHVLEIRRVCPSTDIHLTSQV
jgi:hypothetical protein